MALNVSQMYYFFGTKLSFCREKANLTQSSGFDHSSVKSVSAVVRKLMFKGCLNISEVVQVPVKFFDWRHCDDDTYRILLKYKINSGRYSAFKTATVLTFICDRQKVID